MTSTWQNPSSEGAHSYDVVESLEYRPIMLSEDMSEEMEAREDEDLSRIIEERHQETGTQSVSLPRWTDEGLPFECPLLLVDDDSLHDADGSINSASITTVPIEEEKQRTSEVNSTLDRCQQLPTAEDEAVDIKIPQEGTKQPQREIIDEFLLVVDSNHNPEFIVDLISDAMEGCYVDASSGQSCETVPSRPIEHECWDTPAIKSDHIQDFHSSGTSCFPGDEEEDIAILARESLYATQDELPMYATQEDSEVSLINNKENSVTPSTLVDEQEEGKPMTKISLFNGCPEHKGDQTRVSEEPIGKNAHASSYNCIFDEEDWTPNTPSGEQTLQCDAEEEVDDGNEVLVEGTCLDKVFRPVYTTVNKPASHTPFIESLAPPMRLSYYQAPRIEARGYHSEGHIEEHKCDHTVCASSSESTTARTAFVRAMNLRNRQKSNIFKSPISLPVPLLKDVVDNLGVNSGEAKQDSSRTCHSGVLKEPAHSDEKILFQMSEITACSDSNREDGVDLEETSDGAPLSPDQTEQTELDTPEIPAHLPPDSNKNQTTEDYQSLVGRGGLENNNEITYTDKIIEEIKKPKGRDQHVGRESNDVIGEPGKHCPQNTDGQKNVSTDCNISSQMNFDVLPKPITKPLDMGDDVDSESPRRIAKDHQTHPLMSPKPFEQPGYLARHDNLTRVGAARSTSRRVERLRRRELYRMTREVMLQKDRWERMHQDALRSVEEFNLVRKEVYRLYNRLDNNPTNFFNEQHRSFPN